MARWEPLVLAIGKCSTSQTRRLEVTGEIYGVQVSVERVKAYLRVLERFPLDAVLAAIRLHTERRAPSRDSHVIGKRPPLLKV